MSEPISPKGPAAPLPTPAEGAHTDFAAEMSYGDYLGLDQLLAAQRPRTPPAR